MAESFLLMKMQEAVRLYEDAAISNNELCDCLLILAAPDNVAELLGVMPAYFVEDLKEYVELFPKTGEEWEREEYTFQGAAAMPEGIPEEDYQRMMNEKMRACKDRFRRGVEALRGHFQAGQ